MGAASAVEPSAVLKPYDQSLHFEDASEFVLAAEKLLVEVAAALEVDFGFAAE